MEYNKNKFLNVNIVGISGVEFTISDDSTGETIIEAEKKQNLTC